MSMAVINEFQNNQSMYKDIKIIALGDIAFDRTFLCTMPRTMHATHGTEVLYEVERDDSGSVGSANCTSQFCVNMGADSLLISTIGHDEEGKLVQDILTKNGVRSVLLEIEEIQTVTKFRFFIFNRNQGVYTLFFRADKETYDKLALSYDKSEELIKRPKFQTWLVDELTTCDGLLLDDTEKGFLSSAVLLNIAEMVRVANARRIKCQKKPIIVVADPKRDWQKFKGFPIDFLTPNEEEAMSQIGISRIHVSNDKELVKLTEELYQRYNDYFPRILLKLGNHGAALLEADDKGAKIYRYPAFKALPSLYNIATHCGDMFDAALILSLAVGADIHSAVTFGNYIGSLQFGKLTGTKVTKDDILLPQNLVYMQTHYQSYKFIGSIVDEKKNVVNSVTTDIDIQNKSTQQIFLSYCHADTQAMQLIRSDLAIKGFAVWTDENLAPGTPSWRNAIEIAINQAIAVLVILSPNAKKSRWVNEELAYAEAQEKYIVPLLWNGKEADAVPFGLTTTHFLDIRSVADYKVNIITLSTMLQKLIDNSVRLE